MSGTSPRRLARVAGAFYLLTLLAGVFAQGFVSDALIVWGDATATANNILTHRNLFQWGFAVYLVEMACNVTMTALFYELLAPVSKSVALVSTFLGLVACTLKTCGRIFFLAPLFVLGGAHYLGVFSVEQLRALSLLLLKVNDQGAALAMAFFGFAALLKGYLILRSTFLPRILGALGMLAGVSLLTYLSPTLGSRLFLYVAAIGLLAATPQIVWLLVVGVNEQRWREQAAVATRLDITPDIARR